MPCARHFNFLAVIHQYPYIYHLRYPATLQNFGFGILNISDFGSDRNTQQVVRFNALSPGPCALSLSIQPRASSIKYRISSIENMSATELIKPYFIENRFRILIGLLCLITVDRLTA